MNGIYKILIAIINKYGRFAVREAKGDHKI